MTFDSVSRTYKMAISWCKSEANVKFDFMFAWELVNRLYRRNEKYILTNSFSFIERTNE